MAGGDQPRKDGLPIQPRASREERWQRIELCRQMLCDGYTKSQIKRLFKERFGYSFNTTATKYIAVARKLNREAIGISAEDRAASSVSGWNEMLRKTKERFAHAQKQYSDAAKRLRSIDDHLDSMTPEHDMYAKLVEEKASCVEIIDSAGSAMASAQSREMQIRDRLDKVLGNHAPTKIAETTVDGKDVPHEMPKSKQEESDEIAELHAELMGRMSNPSQN